MPSAAILAGGAARRFDGRDKRGLIVGGISILERQVHELAQMTDDILIVGGNATATSEIILRFVPDRVPGCGPLGGLDAALAAARDDVVMVLACDMPFVTASWLGHLVSLAAEADAVVPRTERGYHPLCAVYTRACLSRVRQRLAGRQLSMAGFLEDVRVRVVQEHEIEPFGDPNRLLANVNSRAEFDEVLDYEP